MAHLDKYTRQELRRILKETYREYDDPTKYENNVDITRTHLNYNMSPDIHGSYDFLNRLDDRVADIIATEMDGKPPRNPPKFASWVITCPKELIGDLNGDGLQIRKFFTEVWDFCCQRYGKENVVDGVVHMDESTPHMTVYIIPECVSRKSGKHSISVATVFQRQELQGFHADLDKQCELTFGQKNLVTRSEEEKAENPYNKKMQDFKKDRLAEELFGTVFTEITEEAAEQAQLILQEAKSKADQIIKDAGKKAEAFEEKRMEEATEKIWTMNDQLGEMRKSAKKIHAEVVGGFGSVEDAMVLSMIDESGQRDDLVLQYKHRYPAQLGQDSKRVLEAKAKASKYAAQLPDLGKITGIRMVNPYEHGIALWDDEYEQIMEETENKDEYCNI